MIQCPIIIAKYHLQCSADTEYGVVQLLSALDLKETHQPEDHGILTAVIQYWSPSFINKTSILIIFFDLGNDVALCSVLGIPCLLAMIIIVDLIKCLLFCYEINQVFMF